jgi:3-oxoacyl-[acyl-carrier protein] reductase
MTREAALVTGARRGIGRAIAERFGADERFDVVACLDVHEGVEETAAAIPGGESYVVDVADQEAVTDAVEDVEGGATITAAVNNAGVSRYFFIADLEPEEWDRILDINLKGQYNVARAVTPRMHDREEGYLVNISSGAGQRGSVSGGVHYSASKAGVFGLTKGLAKQLAPHVRVNCVVPGLIDTPIGSPTDDDDDGLWTEKGMEKMRRLVPLQRRGDPDEVARVVHFLCGDGAGYVTGATIPVDGGSSLMPTQEFLMGEE